MSEAQESEETESRSAAAAATVALGARIAAGAAEIGLADGKAIAGPAIETNRLILRRPQLGDAADIALLADNPRVARALIGMPHPYRVEHALAWILEDAGEGGQKHLVCLKSLGGAPRPIGVATLTPEPAGRPPRLGCWLGEAFWGRGYATEACHAVVDFAFLRQGHARLCFACRVTNPDGRRVIEKCGFQMVAQELARLSGRGELVPVDRFQIDRTTWSSLRGWEPLRLHGEEKSERKAAPAGE